MHPLTPNRKEKNASQFIGVPGILLFAFLLFWNLQQPLPAAATAENSQITLAYDGQRATRTFIPSSQYAYQTLNVLDFGAKGDGIADDTAAIQTAIDQSSRGTTLFFPSGKYQVTSGLELKSGVAYVGEGVNTVITQVGPNFKDALLNLYPVQGVQNLFIQDLCLQGTAEGDSHGLYLTNLYNSELRNVWVQDFAKTGIFLDVLSGKACDTFWLKDAHILRNGGYGFFANNNYTDTHLYRCDIGLNTHTNVVLNAFSSSVRDCTIFASGQGNGLSITSDSVQIYNNQIEGNAGHGVYLAGEFVQIHGNKIYDNANTPETNGKYDGIAIIGNKDRILNGISITYNLIYSGLYADSGVHRYQISLNPFHEHALLAGNSLKYNGNAAIDPNRPFIYGLNVSDENYDLPAWPTP